MAAQASVRLAKPLLPRLLDAGASRGTGLGQFPDAGKRGCEVIDVVTRRVRAQLEQM